MDSNNNNKFVLAINSLSNINNELLTKYEEKYKINYDLPLTDISNYSVDNMLNFLNSCLTDSKITSDDIIDVCKINKECVIALEKILNTDVISNHLSEIDRVIKIFSKSQMILVHNRHSHC
jgi:hypothetical protein